MNNIKEINKYIFYSWHSYSRSGNRNMWCRLECTWRLLL